MCSKAARAAPARLGGLGGLPNETAPRMRPSALLLRLELVHFAQERGRAGSADVQIRADCQPVAAGARDLHRLCRSTSCASADGTRRA